MRKLINVVWFSTFLGFFAALMLSYTFLPEQVGVQANERGHAHTFVTKESFFYIGLFVFAVTNMVCFFSIRMMDAIPASSGIYFKNEYFKNNITGWFAGFVAIINVFMMFATTYIALFNNQGNYHISQFNALVYLPLILVMLSLAWLAYIFHNRHRQVIKEEA